VKPFYKVYLFFYRLIGFQKTSQEHVVGPNGHFQPWPSRGFHHFGVRVYIYELQPEFPLPVEGKNKRSLDLYLFNQLAAWPVEDYK
jgi:hypothetical protein